MKPPLFDLGRLVATPGAIKVMTEAGVNPASLLARHQSGDFGDLGHEDWAANDGAVLDGSRIFSAYILPKTKVKLWVITTAKGDDGSRESTCILLPSEY